MDQSDQLDELLTCRLDFGRKSVEPCTIVIFGASGDLTARKLVPALYHLYSEKQLPNPIRIIGFARREKADQDWRAELKTGVESFSRTKRVDAATWDEFAKNLFYCQGEFSDAKAYEKLGGQLAGSGHEALRNNLLFYLSTSPSQFAEVTEHLAKAQLLRRNDRGPGWQRVVVEKPFGHDLASAQQLNSELTQFAPGTTVRRVGIGIVCITRWTVHHTRFQGFESAKLEGEPIFIHRLFSSFLLLWFFRLLFLACGHLGSFVCCPSVPGHWLLVPVSFLHLLAPVVVDHVPPLLPLCRHGFSISQTVT
jgi:hypothetical protein